MGATTAWNTRWIWRAASASLLSCLAQPLSTDAQVRKAGPEFQVNSVTSFSQVQPRVEVLDSNRFIVVWHGYNPIREQLYGIRGQIFDKQGLPLGEEFLVSRFAIKDEYAEQHPAISRTGSGGFVVAWESYDIGERGAIAAQRFTANGNAAKRELPVSELDQEQQNPAVAADAEGNFVVSWIDKTSYYAARVRSKVFDAKGVPTSSEFGATLEDRLAGDVSVAAQPGGGFLVVWAEEGVGVAGQRFQTDGSPRDSAFLLAPAGARRSQVESTTDGTFVLVWQHYGQDGDGYGVFGRRYASDGTPIGEEFQANTYTADHQSLPSVAIDGDGGFVVVWESYASVFSLEGGQDGSGRGVFGQRFDADGKPQGREFQVNTFVVGDQGNRRDRESDVASWPDGTFVATWTSPDQDGSFDGVFAQIFRVDPSLGPLCGDAANSDLVLSVRDALAILRGAVKLRDCEPCLCDVDASGDVSAADAMAVLNAAVKLGTTLSCPPCASS